MRTIMLTKLKTCSTCLQQRPLWKSNPPTCKGCTPRKPIARIFKTLTKSTPNKYQEKRELNIWFADQIENMPRYCEESGNYLNQYAPWGARTYVAHICPKRHFKSVQTHPDNRMYYDQDVHTDFDRATSAEIKEMKTYLLIVERFNRFKHLIDPAEYEHLQGYLLELL